MIQVEGQSYIGLYIKIHIGSQPLLIDWLHLSETLWVILKIIISNIYITVYLSSSTIKSVFYCIMDKEELTVYIVVALRGLNFNRKCLNFKIL